MITEWRYTYRDGNSFVINVQGLSRTFDLIRDESIISTGKLKFGVPPLVFEDSVYFQESSNEITRASSICGEFSCSVEKV